MRPGLLGAELLLPVRSGGHVFSACRGTQCAAYLSGCQKGEEDVCPEYLCRQAVQPMQNLCGPLQTMQIPCLSVKM